MDFFLAVLASIILIFTTTLLYYEVLRVTWNLLPRLTIKPRQRVLVVVVAIFVGHTLAVWIYGIAYWLLAEYANLGALVGLAHLSIAGKPSDIAHFLDYIYFSATTYSSLGFGDISPTGALRLICGVEVLNGLVLIGWSVSFTYLAMEKFWNLHK